MLKILITGANSYVGTSLEKWLSKWPSEYSVDTLDVKDDVWQDFSFAGYDSVFHVAGIAHVSTDPNLESLYYKVNRDLVFEVASKAKSDGVKQFVFMSSMIVYGSDSVKDGSQPIDANTEPLPDNFYGKSKLEAEQKIKHLESDDFAISIIRAPMVYGPNCKGNFPLLIKLAKLSPIFPNIKNQRSMIYIDNLCEFVRILVTGKLAGTFFPQNREYVSTVDIISTYRRIIGKKIWLMPVPKFCRDLLLRINIVNKAFGSKVYDKALSFTKDYQVIGLEESIKKCTH